jgi:hypothetical protein
MPSDLAGSEWFGATVRRLVLERPRYLTRSGNVSWALVARDAPGVGYETLRKAVAGERAPSEELMRAVAAFLGIDVDNFLEYRLARARELFDPEAQGGGLSGLEQAAENLRRSKLPAELEKAGAKKPSH